MTTAAPAKAKKAYAQGRADVVPGARFSRLTVISIDTGTNKNTRATCRCDCGKVKSIAMRSLWRGQTKSCGCLQKESVVRTFQKHGAINTPEYSVWRSMRFRCRNPNDPKYHNYGGRGISVCDRWESFENFISDMGPRPSENLSLDRIDNDGNYQPGNCRWATITEQLRNTRNNRLLTVDGRTASLAEWSEISGVTKSTLRNRLSTGWSDEDAVKTPVIEEMPRDTSGRFLAIS